MNVYLAALRARRKEMVDVAARLSEAGHVVTSRWILGRGKDASPADNAKYDLTDVAIADCFVLFAEKPAGLLRAKLATPRYVGLGYALRAAKRVVIVGRPENDFCQLETVEDVADVDGLLELLSDRSGGCS